MGSEICRALYEANFSRKGGGSNPPGADTRIRWRASCFGAVPKDLPDLAGVKLSPVLRTIRPVSASILGTAMLIEATK